MSPVWLELLSLECLVDLVYARYYSDKAIPSDNGC